MTKDPDEFHIILEIFEFSLYFFPTELKDVWNGNRVSTKCLYLLRYFRATFFLRTFAHCLRMKRNEFCAKAFFFAKFAQNRKYYTKRNFLSKLSKIVILSKELTTEDSTITLKKY